jgi:hypothetical protein
MPSTKYSLARDEGLLIPTSLGFLVYMAACDFRKESGGIPASDGYQVLIGSRLSLASVELSRSHECQKYEVAVSGKVLIIFVYLFYHVLYTRLIHSQFIRPYQLIHATNKKRPGLFDEPAWTHDEVRLRSHAFEHRSWFLVLYSYSSEES